MKKTTLFLIEKRLPVFLRMIADHMIQIPYEIDNPMGIQNIY